MIMNCIILLCKSKIIARKTDASSNYVNIDFAFEKITKFDSFNVSFFRFLISDNLNTFQLIPWDLFDETT